MGTSLEIYAQNIGYGKACECEISIVDSPLEKIFSKNSLLFKGDIPPDFKSNQRGI